MQQPPARMNDGVCLSWTPTPSVFCYAESCFTFQLILGARENEAIDCKQRCDTLP
jgi:hypothetical protein